MSLPNGDSDLARRLMDSPPATQQGSRIPFAQKHPSSATLTPLSPRVAASRSEAENPTSLLVRNPTTPNPTLPIPLVGSHES